MAISIVTVADSISKLSVAGVTLKDLNEIPEAVEGRDCPIFYPKPDGFLTDVQVERMSFGTLGSARTNVSYTLTWRYLHSEIGEGRGLFDVFDGAIANIALILDALLANDAVAGAIDLEIADTINVGPVVDPAGNWFHGCDVKIAVMEFED